MPVLVAILRDTPDQEKADHWSDPNEAGELRRYAAEAVEWLTDDPDVLLFVARTCLRDRYWKCRMNGLGLLERLGERGQELLPVVQRLVGDEVAEIREWAERVLNRSV